MPIELLFCEMLYLILVFQYGILYFDSTKGRKINMRYDLNRKDVFIWFCRDADQVLASIEAYRRGDAEQPGRTFDEQIGKVFCAVGEFDCTHLLLVCEKGSRYADFLKGEYVRISPSRTTRAICDIVSERELELMLDGAPECAIYVFPDTGDVPNCLFAKSKYLFTDGSLCPWPERLPIEDSVNMGPAAWTQYFLLGSQVLSCQLENVRTILKARGARGVPQYVLITGETGTGKSFIARNLAKICSEKYDDREASFTEESKVRDARVFLHGNCASLSPALADALLFGAVKGAYTGCDRDVDGLIESAGEGILFLDEVGDLPLETQAKLLTALEEKSYYRLGDTGKERKERHVKCNIIFGTNHDLETKAQEWESSHGKVGFRKDLLYRINSCHIELTPLRTRLSKSNSILRDAVLDGIVERYCEGVGLVLTEAARREFDSFACRHEWPGNFRDVKHLFENLNVAALGEGVGRVVSAYAMRKATERLEASNTSKESGADGGDVPLIDRVKAAFPRPFEANDIDFVFEVCRDARSCADAGRAYYGTMQKRNFPDAFGKRLAHYGLVFDKSADGHLAEKRTAADVPAK